MPSVRPRTGNWLILHVNTLFGASPGSFHVNGHLAHLLRLSLAVSCSVSLAAATTAVARAAAPQPGCAVASGGSYAGSTSLLDSAKAKGGQPTACVDLNPTSLGLLVLFDVALLDTDTEFNVRTWIGQRIAEADTLFANSGAPSLSYDVVDVRPVSADLPDYAPGSDRVRIQDVLVDWLEDPQAPFTQLRNAYGADMVMFITTSFLDDYDGGDICGIATVPRWDGSQEVIGATPGTMTPFNKRAFAVMEYKCGEGFDGKTPVNDYTFAHELGHTLGMQHFEEDVAFPVPPGNGLGHVLDLPSGAQVGSALHCVYDASRPVVAGVCGRIPHFSNPQVSYVEPGCKSCGATPTGSSIHDNMAVACGRAVMVSDFGTPDGDLPPTLEAFSSAGSGTVASGATVQVWATATDAEDGNIGASVEWFNRRGELLATGPSANLTPLDSGRIVARVTDSAGQTDEWWLPLEVVATPDDFEPDGTGVAPRLFIGDSMARNFHTPDDLDRALVFGTATPTTVIVDAVATGDRAEPLVSIVSCNAVGCGSPQPVTLPHERQAGISPFAIYVRDADGRSGVGTEYEITVDEVVEPPSLSPLTGPFYNPARNGHGIDFQRASPGHYVAIWYTYRPGGQSTWYISDVAPLQGNVWTAPLYASTWDYVTETNEITEVGAISMAFSDVKNAFFSYDVNGITGGEFFETLEFGGPINGPGNGMWYPPSQSGWGVSLWHRGSTFVVTNYTYDANGLAVFTQASNTGSASGILFDVYETGLGTSICPGCSGTTPVTVFDNVGIAFLDVNTGTGQGSYSLDVDYVSVPGFWDRSAPFVRLTN